MPRADLARSKDLIARGAQDLHRTGQLARPTPWYWSDPKNIVKWHTQLETQPEEEQTPFLRENADNIRAAYQYASFRNEGKPWWQWKPSYDDDPVFELYKTMGNPTPDEHKALEIAHPKSLVSPVPSSRIPAVQAITGSREFAQAGEVAQPTTLQAMEANAPGAVMAGGMALAATPGPLPVKLAAGAMAAYGAASGKTAKSTTAFEDLAAKYKIPSLTKALMVLDYAADFVEKLGGVEFMARQAIFNKDTDALIKLVTDLPTAFDASHWAYDVGVGTPTGLIANITNPAGMLGALGGSAAQQIGGTVLETLYDKFPQLEHDSTETQDQANAALWDIYDGLNQGRTVEDITRDVEEKYGMYGMGRDLVGHMVADPLNVFGIASAGALQGVGKIAGKFAKTDEATKAARLLQMSAAQSEDWVTGMQKYSTFLRKGAPAGLTLTTDEASHLGTIGRMIAGVTKAGGATPAERFIYGISEGGVYIPAVQQAAIKAGKLNRLSHAVMRATPATVIGYGVGGPVGAAFGAAAGFVTGYYRFLTPAARATEYVNNAALDIGRVLAHAEHMADDNADDAVKLAAKWIGSLANNPVNLGREISMTTLGSPEAAAISPMIKSYIPELDIRVKEWDVTAKPRTQLNALAGALDTTTDDIVRRLRESKDKNQLFATMVEEARAKKDNPLASGFVQQASSGEMSGKNLDVLDKLFVKDARPYNYTLWQGELFAGMVDHADEWSAQWFGVKPDSTWVRFGKLIKSAQSAALLGLNPTYLVQNVTNNAVVMAFTGAFGLRSQADVEQFWRITMGVEPSRLKAGLGAAQTGDETSGLMYTKHIRGAQKYSGADSKAVIRDLNLALEDMGSAAGRLTGYMPFTMLSNKAEQISSIQAYTAATMDAYYRMKKVGAGINPLDPSLDAELRKVDPNLPELVYEAIIAGNNKQEIEKQLFGGLAKRQVDGVIEQLGGEFGVSPGELRSSLAGVGVLDALKNGLEGNYTRQQVDQVFSDVQKHIVEHFDEMERSEVQHRAVWARDKIATEGIQAMLEHAHRMIYDDVEARFANDNNWDWFWYDLNKSGIDYDLRDYKIQEMFETAEHTWARNWAKKNAYMLGIANALGTDSPDARKLLTLQKQLSDSWRAAHGRRQELYREHFSMKFDTQRDAAQHWRETKAEVSLVMDRAFETEQQITGGIGETFSDLLSQFVTTHRGAEYGAYAGQAAREWYGNVGNVLNQIHQDIKAHYGKLEGMTQEEKQAAWYKFRGDHRIPAFVDYWKAHTDGTIGVAKALEIDEIPPAVMPSIPERPPAPLPPAPPAPTKEQLRSQVRNVASEFGISTVDSAGRKVSGADIHIMNVIRKYGGEAAKDIANMEDVSPELARQAFEARAQAKITAPAPAGVYGNTTSAIGQDAQNTYEFRYRVVDLDDLVTSHDDRLQANPEYPQELQPRQRERMAGEQQVDKIASQLNPAAMLLDTHRIDSGPMIIGPDLVVESGNGRTIGLRRARNLYPDTYAAYKQQLVSDAAQYGLDPAQVEGMNNPVLVRERTTDVNRVRFTEEANARATLAMSPMETAVQDADRISPNIVRALDIGETETIEQALRSPRNSRVVQAFVGSLPENERAGVMDQGGAINAAGLERIKRALFASTYPGDPGRRLLELFVESADPGMQNLQRSLFSTLGQMAQVEAAIKTGATPGSLSIAEDIAKAADVYHRLKSSGISVGDYVAQVSMFGAELDANQTAILKFLDQNGRSSKALTNFLAEYTTSALRQAPESQLGMFGEARSTKGELLNAAVRDAGRAEGIEFTEGQPGQVYPTLETERAGLAGGEENPLDAANRPLEAEPAAGPAAGEPTGAGAEAGTRAAEPVTPDVVESAIQEKESLQAWADDMQATIDEFVGPKVSSRVQVVRPGQQEMFGAEITPLFSGTAQRGQESIFTPEEQARQGVMPGMEDMILPRMKGAVQGGEAAGPLFDQVTSGRAPAQAAAAPKLEMIGPWIYVKGPKGDLFRAPAGSELDASGYPMGSRWEAPPHMADEVLQFAKDTFERGFDKAPGDPVINLINRFLNNEITLEEYNAQGAQMATGGKLDSPALTKELIDQVTRKKSEIWASRNPAITIGSQSHPPTREQFAFREFIKQNPRLEDTLYKEYKYPGRRKMSRRAYVEAVASDSTVELLRDVGDKIYPHTWVEKNSQGTELNRFGATAAEGRYYDFLKNYKGDAQAQPAPGSQAVTPTRPIDTPNVARLEQMFRDHEAYDAGDKGRVIGQRLAGDGNAELRRDLLQELTGTRPPKAKAGINALVKEYENYRAAKIKADAQALPPITPEEALAGPVRRPADDPWLLRDWDDLRGEAWTAPQGEPRFLYRLNTEFASAGDLVVLSWDKSGRIMAHFPKTDHWIDFTGRSAAEFLSAVDPEPLNTLYQRYIPERFDTPSFRNWFGESKVVDDNGVPLAMYHGSPTMGFDTFSKQSPNSLYGPGYYFTDNPEVASEYAVQRSYGRRLNYEVKGDPLLTEDETAKVIGALKEIGEGDLAWYIRDLESEASRRGGRLNLDDAIGWLADYDWQIKELNKALDYIGAHRKVIVSPNQSGVVEVFLSISNPFDADMAIVPSEVRKKIIEEVNQRGYAAYSLDRPLSGDQLYKALYDVIPLKVEGKPYIVKEILRGAGFDGITHIGGGLANPNDTRRHRVYIAFNPTQIKSAIGNSGAFDPRDPSFLNQGAGKIPQTALPSIKMTREQVRQQAIETGRWSMDQVDAGMAVLDAFALQVSKWYGITPKEWYARAFGGVVGPGGQLKLTDVPRVRRPKQAAPQAVGPAWEQLRMLEQRAQLEHDPSLVALHNLSADNLLHADEIGGLAVPSIAVTSKDIGFEHYGEITLVGNKKLVDPRVGGNRTFSADAYSPTWPRKYWKQVPSSKAQKVLDDHKFVAISKEVDDSFSSQLWDYLVQSPERDRALELFDRYDAPKVAFLREKGIEVDVPRHTVKPGFYDVVNTEVFREWANKNNWEDAYYDPHLDSQLNASLLDVIRKAWQEAKGRPWTSDVIAPQFARDLFRSWEAMLHPKIIVDQGALRGTIRKAFDSEKMKDEYLQWSKDILSVFRSPEIIVRGRKEPYTLYNIVEAMTTKPTRASENNLTFGAGAAKAYGSVEFKDIEQMHQYEGTLAPKSEVDAAKKAQEQVLNDVERELWDHHYSTKTRGEVDVWDANNDIFKAIGYYLKSGKKPSEARAERALWKAGFSGMSEETVRRFVEGAEFVRDTPTEYFEAKPQRAVKLNEFVGAVVPVGTSQQVLDALQRHGLEVKEYGPGERLDAVKTFYTKPDVLFQDGAPVYYSHLARTVGNLPERMTVGHLRSALNKAGVKPDEMKWTGLDDWMSEQGDMTKITRSQVNEFLKANQVAVREIQRAEGGIDLSDISIKETSREYVEPEDFYDEETGEWSPAGIDDTTPEEVSYTAYIGDSLEYDYTMIEDNFSGQYYVRELRDSFDSRNKAWEAIERDAKWKAAQHPQETVYEEYNLPGGHDYRELLLALPRGQAPTDVIRLVKSQGMRFERTAAGDWKVVNQFGEQIGREMASQEDAARYALNITTSDRGNVYQSPHWTEPNVLAHVRFDERTDVDGKRVLFIEEIQSDWHQAGKKRGYKPKEGYKELPAGFELVIEKEGPVYNAAGNYSGENLWMLVNKNDPDWSMPQRHTGNIEDATAKFIDDLNYFYETGVPSAPFADTWPDLAMKRMIRWAAENGYDRVAWTTGDVQVDRYPVNLKWEHDFSVVKGDGSKADVRVLADSYEEALQNDYVKDHGYKVIDNGWILRVFGKDTERATYYNIKTLDDIKKLPGELGKEWAKKVWFAIQENKAGGELQPLRPGMESFYDVALPNKVQKYINKWGGSVGETDLILPAKGVGIFPSQSMPGTFLVSVDGYYLSTPDGKDHLRFFSRKDAQEYIDNNLTDRISNRIKAHSFDVTPAMRESAMQGQPLFQGPKGAVQFIDKSQAMVYAFKAADFSTFVHESGHIMRRWLPAKEMDVVTKWMKDTYKVEVDHNDGMFTGDLSPVTVNGKKYKGGLPEFAEERYAEALETYLMEGKAPTPELRSHFERIKQWLAAIYARLRGSGLVELNDSMRSHFDRILGGTNEISVENGKMYRGGLEVGDAAWRSWTETETGPARVLQGGRQVDTPEFQRWFGKSKVVGANGEPLVVYHGTVADVEFDRFKRMSDDLGFHFGTAGQANDRLDYKQVYQGEAGAENARLVPVYLRLTNPLRLEDAGLFNSDNLSYELAALFPEDKARIMRMKTGEMRRYLQSKGYDGIVYKNTGETTGGKVYQERLRDARRLAAESQAKRGKSLYSYDLEDQATPEYQAQNQAFLDDQNYRRENAEDSYIVFEPTQIKSAIANQGTFDPKNKSILYQSGEEFKQAGPGPTVNPVGMPSGTLDRYMPGPSTTDMAAEAWHEYYTPILDRLRTVMAGDESNIPQNAINKLDKNQMNALRAYLGKAYGELADTKLASIKWGENRRDFALLNYSRRYEWDNVLAAILPYQFFYTRSAMNWALRALGKPAILANYARLKETIRKLNNEPGFPTRLQNKVRIPYPYMGSEGEPGWYVDPLRQLFPIDQLISPIERYSQQETLVERRAKYILSDWIAMEKVSPDDPKAAEKALAQARVELETEVNNPFDFMSMMIGTSLPAQWGYNIAKKTPNKISQLPATRFIQSMSALAGANQGRGWNVEGPLRRALGMPERGNTEDFLYDRELARMVAEGAITLDQAQRAMMEKSGDAYLQAQQRVSKLGAVRNLAGFMALDAFPESEAHIRGLRDDYEQAIKEEYEEGKKGSIGAFYDKYPEYAANSLMGDSPDDKMRYYLKGVIWDKYMDLPDLHKRQVREQFGKIFQDNFLSSETRSYNSIDTMTMAMWARQLNGYIPSTAGTLPQAGALELAEQAPTRAFQQYNDTIDQRFPGIYQEQEIYFSLPEGPAREKFLGLAKSRLGKFWDWKNRYYADHPEILPFVINEQSEVFGAPPEIQQAYYDYKATQAEQFPNFYEQQSEYFGLDKKGRKAYLKENPELGAAWTWQRTFMANFPALIPYIRSTESIARDVLGDDYKEKYGIFEPVDISGMPPTLMEQVVAHYNMGMALGAGANAWLNRLWNESGSSKPYKQWIEEDLQYTLMGIY